MVPDWADPVRVASVDSPCPEDAIEIARDGQTLFFMFTTNVLDSLTAAQILARPNGTYFVRRTGGPGDFGAPSFFDLGKNSGGSLDGAPSSSPDGKKVCFHSPRAAQSATTRRPRPATSSTSTSPT